MTPTRVLPLTGCTPAGIPATPDPATHVTPTCLKCQSAVQGYSCHRCEGLGYIPTGWNEYEREYHDCPHCEGMGEYFECDDCGARWDTDEMHGQALETLRGQWKLMVAA